MAFTLLIAIFIAIAQDVQSVMTPEQLVIRHLLSNHSKDGRPIQDPRQSVNVTIQLYIAELLNLDEVSQIISVYAWTDLMWHDDTLRWNPTEWYNVTKVSLLPNALWLPDVGLVTRVEFDEVSYNYRSVKVRHDGSVEWRPGGVYTTLCYIDTTLFPFDVQSCIFEFENWMHSDSEIRLCPVSDHLNLVYLHAHNEWDFKRGQATIKILPYSENETYTTINYHFHLKRKPGYYIINVIFPSAAIIVLGLLVFLIPEQSGEKISFGMAILVAFSVFLLQVGSHLPRSSEHVPFIAVILLLNMGAVMATLGSSAITIHMYNMYHKQSVPQWMRRLLLWQLGMKKANKRVITSGDNSNGDIQPTTSKENARVIMNQNGEQSKKVEIEDNISESKGPKEEWLVYARVVERFFILFWISLLLAASGMFFYMIFENNAKWNSIDLN